MRKGGQQDFKNLGGGGGGVGKGGVFFFLV